MEVVILHVLLSPVLPASSSKYYRHKPVLTHPQSECTLCLVLDVFGKLQTATQNISGCRRAISEVYAIPRVVTWLPLEGS
jgi:hypothetical protein